MSARLLVVDDEASIRLHLEKYFRRRGLEVLTAGSGEDALKACAAAMVDVVLLDLRLPDMDGLDILAAIKASSPQTGVIMITAHGDIDTAVRAMQMGADNFLVKALDLKALEVLVEKIIDKTRAQSEILYLKDTVSRLSGYRGPVKLRFAPADSQAIHALAQSSSAGVLIQGETGTGKGMAARLIHDLSARARENFVEVNCASLTPEFFESGLFGHEKGAFTDAKQFQRGLLELAHKGTLLLDEVAELNPSAQARLLKVIEDKTFRRLGGTANIHVDTRVLAATNTDLERAVKAGRFRKDLYYRLNVMPLVLAPLRQRREDILPLAHDFLEEFAGASAKPIRGFTRSAEAALEGYAWPGNIRELRNLIERAVLLCRGSEVAVEHFPGNLLQKAKAVPSGLDEDLSLEGVERKHIASVLQMCEGNHSLAARRLGIHRSTLLQKIQKYGLGE